ncbi:hypothetical protein [Flavipsychrobacter stenotrophus]|nr:hypothetical protein [Flavipsychrobacter stenotrophus]
MKKVLSICLLALVATYADAQTVKGILRRGAGRAADKAIDVAVDKGIDKLSGNDDQGASTQKRAGQIVFSGSLDNLKKDAEIESGFSESFALDAPIYFRAYYAYPLTSAVRKVSNTGKSVATEHGRFKVRFLVDAGEQYVGLMQQDAMDEDQKQTWTTFKGALQPAAAGNYLLQDVYKGFLAEYSGKLANGNHTITMQLIPYTDYPSQKEGGVVASGTFTLVGKKIEKAVSASKATAKSAPAAQQQSSVDPREAFLNVSYKLDGRKMTVLVDENGTAKPLFMETTSSTFTSDEYKIFALDGKKHIATYKVGRDVNKITMIINVDKNKKQEFDLTTYLDRCSSSLEKDAVKRKNPVYWLYKNGYAK